MSDKGEELDENLRLKVDDRIEKVDDDRISDYVDYKSTDPLWNVKLNLVDNEPKVDDIINVDNDCGAEDKNGNSDIPDENSNINEKKIKNDEKNVNDEKDTSENEKVECLREMKSLRMKKSENWLQIARNKLRKINGENYSANRTPQKKIYRRENLHVTPGSNSKNRKVIDVNRKSSKVADIKNLWERKLVVNTERKLMSKSTIKPKIGNNSVKKIISKLDLKSDSVNVSFNGEKLKPTILLDNWVVRNTGVGKQTEVKLNERNERVDLEKGLSDSFQDENHRNDEIECMTYSQPYGSRN